MSKKGLVALNYGKIAYEAYARARKLPFPGSFEKLEKEVQRAWKKSAQAVAEALTIET